MGISKKKGPSAPALRKDPYEVLCVSRDWSLMNLGGIWFVI